MSSPKTALNDLLRSVSRSFYLTLAVLPRSVRAQVSVAYLLARATDTIADACALPVSERLRLLDECEESLRGGGPGTTLAGIQPGDGATPGEIILLRRFDEIRAIVDTFSPDDAGLIREVLATITGGQRLDLTHFGAAGAGHLAAFQSDEELDGYTFAVAGSVGLFWTRLCRSHLFPAAPLDLAALLDEGTRFGKGLQLVNILRDLPADLRRGRCYLPAPVLAAAGLQPEDLLKSETEPRFRPVYENYLDLAERHLRAAWRYTNRLPRGQARLRLACAWPVLIGQKTIEKLRGSNVLDARERVKIGRREVRAIMIRTALYYPFPNLWRGLALQ